MSPNTFQCLIIFIRFYKSLSRSFKQPSRGGSLEPSGGMNAKTYQGSHLQSDTQAAQVFNMRWYKDTWDSFGNVLFAFLEALLLSPWISKDMYENVEDVFFNNMTGYYFVLINIMELQGEYGKGWVHHFLPLVTVQNVLSNVGNLVARCLFHPKESGWARYIPPHPPTMM